MKFRDHAAEIKNKSEIPSLEKFIGMKVLHASRNHLYSLLFIKKGGGEGEGFKKR